MNQEKIGRFIALCRKQNGFTQASLAEKLGITDRAVSKWENGKSMPDASIMLELCGYLKINVNELLMGEHIAMENYKEIAEQNLVEMRKQEEQANKRLMSAEYFLVTLAVVASLAMITTGILIATENWIAAAVLCSLGALIIISAIVYGLKIEHDAGYYECKECKYRFVPKYKEVLFSLHMGTTRYLKCPKCHEKTWAKKVMTK